LVPHFRKFPSGSQNVSLLRSDNTTTATFANGTAILVTHEDPMIASMKLEPTVNKIDDSAKKLRIKINQKKFMHILSTIRNQTCLTVQVGNVDLPQRNEAKYLGMHLNRRLTWAKHIKTKTKEINQEPKHKHWILGRRLTLSTESKLLYKAHMDI
jgi:hypothetical protein